MSTGIEPPESGCWKKIGVFGDSSCPRLSEHGHCRNCDEYSAAAKSLFDREVPHEELRGWTEQLSQVKQRQLLATVSVVVFRVKGEWLALPVQYFQEAFEPRPVHKVPFRSNEIFQGLVNVNGELVPCISLANLLGLADEPQKEATDRRKSPGRMVVLDEGKDRFVFAADEVLGVRQFAPELILKPPSTLSKSPASLSRGVIEIEARTIGWLDENKLAAAVKGSFIR
ncbi:MAG: chemotaxis protein CheW [Acidobacteriota bacterium]